MTLDDDVCVYLRVRAVSAGQSTTRDFPSERRFHLGTLPSQVGALPGNLRISSGRIRVYTIALCGAIWVGEILLIILLNYECMCLVESNGICSDHRNLFMSALSLSLLQSEPIQSGSITKSL